MFADILAIPTSKIHYLSQKNICKDQLNFEDFINSLGRNLNKIPSDELFIGAEYNVITPDENEILILHECILFPDHPFNNYDMQPLSISLLAHLGLITYDESKPYSPGTKFESNSYVASLEKQYVDTNKNCL